jgi:hypothetical protein
LPVVGVRPWRTMITNVDLLLCARAITGNSNYRAGQWHAYLTPNYSK